MFTRFQSFGAILFTAFLVSVSLGQESKPQPASRVFVVNTQDASVSLVDIPTMREIRRIPLSCHIGQDAQTHFDDLKVRNN